MNSRRTNHCPLPSCAHLFILPVTLVLFPPHPAHSQGAISADDPALVLWLDASDPGALFLGGPSGPDSVSAWTDKKNGVIFNQAVARSFPLGPTPQPTPQTAPLGPNNLTSVDFARSSMLDTPDRPGTGNPLDLTGAAHLFAILNQNSNVNAIGSFFAKGLGNGGGDTNYIFGADLGSNDANVFQSGSGTWRSSNAGAVPFNTPLLYEVRFDASLPTANYQFFIDGNPVGSVTDNAGWLPREGYGAVLGVQGAADTTGAGVFVNDVFFAQGGWVNAFDGAIGELVVYKAALDPTQTAAVRQELINKWLVPGGNEEPPDLTDVQLDPSTRILTITWRSEPGQRYRIERSPDLENWSPAGSTVGSAGAVTTFELNDLPPDADHFFARVEIDE